MKSILALVLLLSLSSYASEASSTEYRAIEVKFYGGITGFDRGAYRTLRSAITSFIVEGTIDQYITKAVGLEGGSTFCVELNPDPVLSIDPILEVLRAIKPMDNNIYDYKPIVSCLEM